MTAINIIRQTDRIWFMTDAAAYSSNGVIDNIASKVIRLGHIRSAIAMRGGYENGCVLRYMMEENGQSLGSFDALLQQMPAIIKAATQVYHRTTFELLFGGYSDARERMETYVCYSRGGGQAADTNGVRTLVPAATPVALHDMSGAPAPTADLLMKVGLGTPIPNNLFDPREHGLALMEAQRMHKTEGGWHCVGGYAELTTVTREGVTSEILRRWPDKVGEPIRPSSQLVLPSGLNRKQRRATAATVG